MGGAFSGRWFGHAKATTVEACLCLDANLWAREGALEPGRHQSGTWRWLAAGGEEMASIGYEAHVRGDDAWVRLFYAVTPHGGKRESVDYRVPLSATRPRLGGVRYWFRCPLLRGPSPCLRRSGKLYLAPGGRYFGCRPCQKLTYRSAQEHDKRVDALRKNPELVEGMIGRIGHLSVGELGLLLKALG